MVEYSDFSNATLHLRIFPYFSEVRDSARSDSTDNSLPPPAIIVTSQPSASNDTSQLVRDPGPPLDTADITIEHKQQPWLATQRQRYDNVVTLQQQQARPLLKYTSL